MNHTVSSGTCDTVADIPNMVCSFRVLVVLVLAMFVVVSCMPSGWGSKHEHVVVHVPYKIHHVHHYHKVPVYIHKEVVHHSHDSHGWDWD